MQSKVVSFKVDQTELKSIDETLDRMKAMVINTPIRVTRSDALRSLIQDQRLHQVSLADLSGCHKALSELPRILHEIGGRSDDEIVTIVKGVMDAINHARNDSSLITEVE